MATLKFGGASKCMKCEKSAYPQESIVYDNMTYHKACFKCLSCSSSVTLSKVAMIKGDLYCKTCFLRMFSEKGTYHVFGDKTLPKAMKSPRNRASTADSSSSEVGDIRGKADSMPKTVASPEPVAEEEPAPTNPSPTPNAENVENAEAKAASASPPPPETTASPAPDSAENEAAANRQDVNDVLTALQAKSVPDLKAAIAKHGVSVLLESHHNITLLEMAFEHGHSALGSIMVEAIGSRLTELEAQAKKN